MMRILLALLSLAITTVKAQDTLYIKKDSSVQAVPCKILRIQQGGTVNSTKIYYKENNIDKDISLSEITYYKLQADQQVVNIPRKDRPAKTQSEIKALSRGWLVFSGTTIIASGICNMISANKKIPTNTNSIDDYNRSQKNLHNISSGLNVISGISLIIGIKIYLK